MFSSLIEIKHHSNVEEAIQFEYDSSFLSSIAQELRTNRPVPGKNDSLEATR